MDKIEVRGARTHNLKNINLVIPRDKLIVVTGLSGSGKSSLAFDTLYAEGQRRYVESLSAYARQFLSLMEAGRRPYRRAVAGDFHRTEINLSQPPLDGGYYYRNSRLSASAVRPRRRTALSGSRRAAGGANRQSDGR